VPDAVQSGSKVIGQPIFVDFGNIAEYLSYLITLEPNYTVVCRMCQSSLPRLETMPRNASIFPKDFFWFVENNAIRSRRTISSTQSPPCPLLLKFP